MRNHRSRIFIPGLFLLPIAAAMTETSSAALVITEAMSDSGHPGGAANGDWWELTNTGPVAVDLEGYIWNDDGGDATTDEAIFPAVTIGTGESIVIVDENSGNLPDFVAAWGGGFTAISADDFSADPDGNGDSFSGLGGGGDTIFLWDPAQVLVDSFTFGDATEGSSVARFTTGVDAGLSVDGVFGAFVASGDGDGGTGSDIGSPGITLAPEPSAIALALGSVLGFTGRRRRL